jgi:hypothetical protein
VSNVPISPEQRDAEASQPLEGRDLEAAIGLHRALFAADLNWLIKLHDWNGESGADYGVLVGNQLQRLNEDRIIRGRSGKPNPISHGHPQSKLAWLRRQLVSLETELADDLKDPRPEVKEKATAKIKDLRDQITTTEDGLPLEATNGKPGIGTTGLPYNHLFEAFLEGHYSAFPWSKAMLALRDTCRVTHRPKHTDREEWRGSLCASLVGMVIRLDYSLDMARLGLGLPDEGRTRRTLDNSLMFIERRLEDAYWREQQGKPVERSPAEWMAAGHVHVGLPGLHAQECLQCLRQAS